ncbi:salicylate hydroxylase [Fusarium oxysporum]|nr:salicylate hydroxylase [Fusarium oxysporum]
MHIIIMGAGPAGLAAALALSQITIQGSPPRITILELRPKFETLGGTILLTPLALRYLDILGVGSRLRKLGIPVRGVDVVALRTGRTLGQMFPGTDVLRVMRYHLVQCMADAVAEMPKDRVNLRYGARVTDIQQVDDQGDDEGTVRVDVQSNSVKSKESLGGDILLGHIAVTTSGGKPILRDSTMIQGQHGSFLMTYFEPSREKVYALAIMPMAENQDAREGWKALGEDKATLKRDIVARFEEGSIKGLKPIINESDWYFYPVYMLPPAGKWSKGRVLLLGDAAHAMPPQGESTGIAIEDGVLFAHVLSEGISTGVPYVMEAYEALRRHDIKKLHAETMFRWNAGSSSSWLWSIVMECITWAYLLLSNYRQKDYFKRDAY